MLSALLLTMTSATLAYAAAAPEPPPQRIVVTGQRIQDFRDRLAACLARNCPTNEDADASLALAEALFLAGDYRDGRGILQASLRRNSGNARNFPEPVSDLYRAHARLSRHLGFADDTRRSSYGTLQALREGLPTEDHRHFTARLELAENLISAGNIGGARRELRRLAEIAGAAGRADVVVLAELRGLWFDYIASRAGEEGNGAAETKARLARLSENTDPAERMRAAGARILLARIYRIEGDAARSETLLAGLGRSSAPSSARRVLYSPPYQLATQQIEPINSASTFRELIRFSSGRGQTGDNFENTWIDVGFWVLPNGEVSGLEVLRRGANLDWADPLLRSIRGRRYTQSAEASYRLERYSYTADYERTLRSHIAQRSRRARVEYLDLTVEGAAPGPPPAAETPSH